MSDTRRTGWVALALVLSVALTACAAVEAPRATEPTSQASTPAAPTPLPSASTAASSAHPVSPAPSLTPIASRPASPPQRLSLAGDRRNALAFASLDDPNEVTVEGRVSGDQAWSTSKVLVVAAFLDTVADGDPDRVSSRNQKLIHAALSESDAAAVAAVRDQIPGRPGQAMTAVLRSIGDQTTVAPDSYQGLMPWSAREQVRFMTALAAGKVVSRTSSRYLLESMRPIRAHSWGLGRVGASAYKGGWLRGDTVTRQMGIVNGYAVVIMTRSGPAVRQTDGDSAHVQQMNRLARLLAERIAWEQSHR